MPCEACIKIGQQLAANREWANDEVVILCTYGEMKRRLDCETCQQMLAVVAQRSGALELEDEAEMHLRRFRQPASAYQICDEDFDAFMLEIAPLAKNDGTQSTGVRLDEWIDLERVKSWFAFCDKEHSGTCHGLPEWQRIPPLDSLLLLDVQKSCLVLAAGTARYFALSYMWGKAGDSLVTKKDTYESFTQPGSIRADSSQIANTIGDAMRLLIAVNERYLWVDRLCIVQDDLEHKQKQIDAMGSIYANSYCTIIAGEGNDANHGLRGVGNGTLPRSSQQVELKFPGCPALIQFCSSGERFSIWNTRGWTFQEQLLSRRKLMFVDSHVAWQCQCSRWEEDITGDPEGVITEPPGTAHPILQMGSWPNLPLWRRLVVQFNKRQLTYDLDVLKAFTGVETVLRQFFAGGMWHGLPELFFDVALLWQPMEPLRRRCSDEDCILPSWSWVAWQGRLDPKGWQAGFRYLRSRGGMNNEGETTWTVRRSVEFLQKHEASGESRIINDRPAVWSDAPDESPVLAGWQKHSDDHSGRVWFTHPLATDVTFWNPVPVSVTANTPCSQSRSPDLSFSSGSGFFVIGRCIPSLFAGRCMTVSVCDEAGRWAGCLRLNRPISSATPVGQACELVEISRGSAQNDADESAFLEEWLLDERPKTGVLYEFINVLWIVRKTGWAERLALGRVELSAWLGQSIEEVDIFLR